MKNQKFKVSFLSKWDENGTYYNQAISINHNTLERLNDCICAETAQMYPRNHEYCTDINDAKLFLKPLLIKQDNVVFTYHTQRNFINIFLNRQLKRKLLDRNTYLLIK